MIIGQLLALVYISQWWLRHYQSVFLIQFSHGWLRVQGPSPSNVSGQLIIRLLSVGTPCLILFSRFTTPNSRKISRPKSALSMCLIKVLVVFVPEEWRDRFRGLDSGPFREELHPRKIRMLMLNFRVISLLILQMIKWPWQTLVLIYQKRFARFMAVADENRKESNSAPAIS